MVVDPAQRARSVRDFLLGDHERLEALFVATLDEFRAGDPDEVRRMWSRFEKGLLGHFAAEERHLLPLYDQAQPGEAAALLAEHAAFRRILEELGVGVDLHVVKLAVAQGLIDGLRAHARREDHLLYLWAERELEGSRQKAVARELGGSEQDPPGPQDP